jgi:hypothetical protein
MQQAICFGPYRLDQDWIGTVEMALCGEPSITLSL